MNGNVQAEKLLLAGFMRYPASFFDYMQNLSSDDFSTKGSKMIYETLHSLLVNKESKAVSRNKLLSEARDLGYQNFVKVTRDGDLIDEMLAESVQESDIAGNFLAVKKQTVIRSYLSRSREVEKYLNETSDPLSKIIPNVENKIISAVQSVDCGETNIVDISSGLKDHVFGIAKNPGNMGVDIGFPIFQSRIGQVRNASVTFIVAHMKAGKTQLGMSTALRTKRKFNIPVLYIDTELSESDQKTRIVGMLAKVPYDVIESGYWSLSKEQLEKEKLSEEEVSTILEYGRRMRDDQFWEMAEKLNIHYLSASGKTLDDLIPHMRRWVLTKVRNTDPDNKVPKCLIIYDYLKLSSLDELSGGKFAEWQIHGLNYAKLHDFSKRHNLPVIAFGQTNNSNYNDEQCIAGAKRIGENVTSASIFRQKTEEERGWDPNGSHIIKNFVTRHGGGMKGPGYINVDADLSIGEFTEMGFGTVNFEEKRQKQLEDFKKRRSGRRKDEDDDE